MKALTDAEAAIGDCCANEEFPEFTSAVPAACMDDLKGIVTDVETAV